MKEIKKQTGIRISESRYNVLKDVAEYLGINSIGELVEMIIDDSFEGTSPFSSDNDLLMIEKIKEANGILSNYIEDTIIFPAHEENFNNMFLSKNQWDCVNISDKRRANIKYACAYLTLPNSCITHIAEVQEIVQKANSSKCIIYLKPNTIKPLNNIIKSTGRKDAIRARRYTNYKKLLNANFTWQL